MISKNLTPYYININKIKNLEHKNNGIKLCICNGTGKIMKFGGKPISCPYCSPKLKSNETS